MSNFIFIPVGGLANRMKAVASSFILAQQNQIKTNVIWFKIGLYTPLSIQCLNQSILLIFVLKKHRSLIILYMIDLEQKTCIYPAYSNILYSVLAYMRKLSKI